MNPWVLIVIAIAFEIVATSFLRATEGFTRLLPTIGVLAAYAVAFLLLSRAIQTLEVGVVYAVWSAVGTSLVAIIGVLFLGDSVSPLKVASLLLIVLGVVGLNLSGAHRDDATPSADPAGSNG